ncbi:ATP-dependent RNA helicase chl1 [Lecanosticta acicola]|uniref:ATP-dependent DNA helicase CHL1 n=1 Tax=Lecanosticta acicola TaxID=111012 RepID=A0AAI9ED58_9PEZI|nr:ATP-dependent RNA helicase chl1 [Lecanosticta acicola]
MARKDFHHPFEPYEIQQQFMEAVYNCIEDGKVGIFESPTGTGKSLSLICGSLTWLREHKRRAFDEAMAAIELEEDDPEWMKEHARRARSRQIRQLREDFEARLDAIREREQKVRERYTNGEPAFKRQKHSGETSEKEDDEDQFVLDDYQSEDEQTANPKTQYSADTAKLMEKLGLLLPKDSGHSQDEQIEETKIYFCSRTHSQLSQFVGELQRVKLPPGLPPENAKLGDATPGNEPTEALKHMTLGSRKNLCIHPRVNKLSSQVAINERCIELQQSNTPADKKCQFLPNKDSEDQVLDFRDHALAKIRDIEDLAKLGSKLQICPYYASRPGIGSAEIVTLPYPLLLQKAAREALGISLKGHAIVIDEAHNLMNAVESIYSVQISELQLRRAKDGLIVYLQNFRNRLKGSNRSYVTQVVRVIDSLVGFVNDVKGQSGAGATALPSALLAGKAVDQINLAKLVRYINESKLARKVEGYASYLQQEHSNEPSAKPARAAATPDVPTLTHVQNFLLALMNPSREGRFMWSKANDTVTLQYLLLDPSEHFRDIVEEARAVVLAGGTMSPMEDYKQQLFPYLDSIVTFSCGHLIPPSSLFVRAVSSDVDGLLDFSFQGRNHGSALRLGRAIHQIADKVEGGTVVFFPSYGYLEAVIKTWKEESIMSQLDKANAVFFDSRAVPAEDTFRAYSEAVRSDKRGALLLSVIGGKLSEGINFSDDLGRCVVVVGLPYPNLETPEWKAKTQYLDQRAAERGASRGKASREHAENVCMRSVNQAIGRAIRHKNDWASILLFDARYSKARIRSKLPGWIKASSKMGASGLLKDVVEDLGSFFDGKLV